MLRHVCCVVHEMDLRSIQCCMHRCRAYGVRGTRIGNHPRSVKWAIQVTSSPGPTTPAQNPACAYPHQIRYPDPPYLPDPCLQLEKHHHQNRRRPLRNFQGRAGPEVGTHTRLVLLARGSRRPTPGRDGWACSLICKMFEYDLTCINLSTINGVHHCQSVTDPHGSCPSLDRRASWSRPRLADPGMRRTKSEQN